MKSTCRKKNKLKQKRVYTGQLKVAQFAETEPNGTCSRYCCYFHDLVPKKTKSNAYFLFPQSMGEKDTFIYRTYFAQSLRSKFNI
jgi:hypothetical protein